MRVPKNRTIPLTTAMARFVDVADLIKSRATADENLQDLCEDYRLAREILNQLKKERPKPNKKIAEYSGLVEGLEEEIMAYLLKVDQKSKPK